jgi:hypothetical protein
MNETMKLQAGAKGVLESFHVLCARAWCSFRHENVHNMVLVRERFDQLRFCCCENILLRLDTFRVAPLSKSGAAKQESVPFCSLWCWWFPWPGHGACLYPELKCLPWFTFM